MLYNITLIATIHWHFHLYHILNIQSCCQCDNTQIDTIQRQKSYVVSVSIKFISLTTCYNASAIIRIYRTIQDVIAQLLGTVIQMKR